MIKVILLAHHGMINVILLVYLIDAIFFQFLLPFPVMQFFLISPQANSEQNFGRRRVDCGGL